MAADFHFVHKPLSRKWSIIVPRRSDRPDVAHDPQPVCPFCPGREGEGEIDRYPKSGARNPKSEINSNDQNSKENSRFGNSNFDGASKFNIRNSNFPPEWLALVIPNKYPFALHHELIIHSPDHHKNIDELPISQAVRIFELYQRWYKVHQSEGTVVIFHNRGEKAGESIPHPHTQLAVLPHTVRIETPQLRDLFVLPTHDGEQVRPIQTDHFQVLCPATSDWPDEVIIAPKRRRMRFGDATKDEIGDVAKTLQEVLHALSRHFKEEFPFNFYIYPLFDWYIRIIPREKVLGGFEIATNIPVVTRDPAQTMSFLRENLGNNA